MPSAQCDTGGCGDVCETREEEVQSLRLPARPKSYSYTWVLKKKRIRGHQGGDCGADGGCDSCGTGDVYPSGQYASPQAYGSGQSTARADLRQRPGLLGSVDLRQRPGLRRSSGQAYGGSAARPTVRQAQRPSADLDVPPAGAMTPAPAGDEAPPAPEVPSAPDPAPAAPGGPGPQRSPEQPALLDPVGQLSILP